MNRTSRNLCVVRDALKIISDRQKNKVELLATVKQEIQTLANKNDCGLTDEVYKLMHDILDQLSKPQYRKVTHDLTTKTWWLVGVGIVLFFLVFFLTVQIYDQSKEIDRLELSDWKYRALCATLQCQQFVINYEDSVRRRYQMEHEAAMRDSIGRLMIRQSKEIKKRLE